MHAQVNNNAAAHACCPVNACMCVSVVDGGKCIMEVCAQKTNYSRSANQAFNSESFANQVESDF